MPLSEHRLNASIAVSDIQKAVAFYDQFAHDAKGITARAGGGRIAWFQDPDGNTFAIEADV